MANPTRIREALAKQITTYCTNPPIRAEARPRDQVNPPVVLIVPGNPFVQYDTTLGVITSGYPQRAMTLNLIATVVVSDASTVERVQENLDAWLGLGDDMTTVSVAQAVEMDPSLGGTVAFAVPVNVTNYNRIQIAGQDYFGARVHIQIGT